MEKYMMRRVRIITSKEKWKEPQQKKRKLC